MKIYNVIHCVYDCDERYHHDGDPVIHIYNCAKLIDAQKFLNEIVAKYQAELDEDGEPQDDFDCEVNPNGKYATCTSESIEAVITIEENELI